MTFQKLLRDSTACVLVALVAGTMVALLLTAIRGAPAPMVHDEFAYLLGADTFASGRVTNPTHPMWQHFESFHIIHQPTYTCKYPPAQALTLAGGQWLGHPIIGSCLATGFAIGCLVWMLTGWLPRKYFWVILLFSVFHPGLQIIWGQSYWGGNLALAGASLLLGALGRLTSKMEIHLAVIAAIGTILLANSRPFEGAILTATVGLALVWQCSRNPNWNLRPFLLRVILPGVAVLAIGIGWMLIYNASVSGSPFKMPYRIHEATYGWNPLFLWESVGAKPEYRHPVMEKFFETDKAINDAKFRTLSDLLKIKTGSAYSMLKFFCGGAMIVALFGLPWLLRRARFRWALIVTIPVFLASLATPWAWAHYCAPAAPMLVLLFLGGLIETWKRTRNFPVLRFAILVIVPVVHLTWWTSVYGAYGDLHRRVWANDRMAIKQELLAQPGPDLVLVRYSDHHNPIAEWVYNQADIDGAQIVWAREMSEERRYQLLEYFEKRNVWVVEADADPPTLRPFRNIENTNQKLGMKTR